ncbi:MAG: membrane protein insertion efficiency factor YidD [Solirubrobacterales bacterium]
MRRAARWIAVLPLKAYRLLVSPLTGRRCKYEPSCSAYASNAVETYGVARGTILALWRLSRCNPLSRGGYDPVSAQKVFR